MNLMTAEGVPKTVNCASGTYFDTGKTLKGGKKKKKSFLVLVNFCISLTAINEHLQILWFLMLQPAGGPFSSCH